MTLIKWILLSLFDLTLIAVAYVITPVLCLFTSDGFPEWGKWLWTYDNPPEGDDGFKRKRAPYTPAVTSWQRYCNRIAWLWRNPTYGYAKFAGVDYKNGIKVIIIYESGHGIDTSDKEAKAGCYAAKCVDAVGRIIAFEFYGVFPYSKNHCLRMRLGWKILSDKFIGNGFAPLVHMINPFKYFGESVKPSA